LSSKTLGLGAGSQINANGVVSLSASTLNGPGSITNAGQLLLHGTTALNGAVATTATSVIVVQGNGSFGAGNPTVASGFTNNGTIILTDSTSSYGATLHVTSGTLTNGVGAIIDVRVGASGTRTLDAQLDNQGTVNVNRGLSITKSAAAHSNSGTININAKLFVLQGGASPSFTNTGTIAIAATDTMAVQGGLLAYSGGSINTGVLAISSATVDASQDFTTATAALTLTNSTWGGSGTLTIASSTTLAIAASTINSPVDNQGTLTVHGSTAFNAAVTNAATGTLRLQGHGSFGTANMTVANGFTNNGTVVLTDTTSSYGAALNVTSGTLTNAVGATITASAGAGGPRSLNAQLDNQGTLTLNRPLTLNKASAAQLNSGTIAVLGKLTILQTGTSPSFTNTGAINIASGDTVAVTGGAFNYSGGAMAGPGAISFASTSLTLTPDLTTGAVAFTFTSTTVGGTGHVIVDPSTQLQVRASTINAKLVNQGQLDLHGSTAINDSLTNASGATLRLQGDGTSGTANITVANGFTNSGALVLTDTTSCYGAVLNLPAGQTLTNAPGATIDAALGTNGPRTLNLELNNRGTVTLNRPLTINRASAQHVNSGTIAVSGGDLTLTQSGTTPSFTTSGTITIGAGRTLTITGGTLNYNAGTVGGSGTLAISAATVSTTLDFSTATTALTLTNGTWGGSGKLTVAAGTLLDVRGSTINSRLVNLGNLDAHGSTTFNDSVSNASGATLRLQGNGSYGTSALTVLNGFTNDGTIVLTDSTSSYGATLHVTNGTLTNAAGALIRADSGTNGPRTLDAQLDNEGTLTLARPLTLTKASAQHVNRGTINANAKLTISQSGTTPSFRQLGTIAIRTGDTVALSAGTFVYDSGTISGGALSLSGMTVAAAHDFSTASTGLKIVTVTWGGSGTLTVAPSTALVLAASTINSAFVNQGAATVNGSSVLNGAVTNAAGATLRIEGNGTYNTGNLTLANGFTSKGTILLTDVTSSYGAVLNVTAGALVNDSVGTIRADTGTGGPRSLNSLLSNKGTFVVATGSGQTTTINKASAAHQNLGTMTIASGTLTFIGSGSAFTNETGGTIAGSGTLNVGAISFFNDGDMKPGGPLGTMTFTGAYRQVAPGALNIEIGGTTAGTQYDRLAVSGTATLASALNVTLANGFTPALGDTFMVLTFASRTGTIPTLNGLLLGGGVQLDTLWSATSLRLFAIALSTTHATDITTNETWTAVTSPHIVSGYLKIVSGATLTIEDGATVKFDAGAGLQLGDTASGNAGNLVMLGTPGSIHLTANTASPVPGFWRGLEIQKTSGPQTWRNVDIEYAGGTRPNLIDESCILLVDPAAIVDLDSVHIRQCIQAGVHHFAGNLHVHRSEIDSVSGAGIQSFAGVLRVDSTSIRGSGQMGLIFGNGAVDLAGAVANKFTGNAGGSVQMFGHQLPGFGRQDSIAGNGVGTIGDTIVVDSGTVGTGVSSFTIYRQPAPYLVTGFLSVWSSSGVNVSLDTGLVMAFDTSAALSVGDFGDSTGATSGNTANFVSLGTAAQPVVLRNRPGRPGWEGLFLGSQSGTPIVRHLRLVRGGYQPQLGQVCQNCLIKTTGFFEPLNTSLFVDAPNGTAPFTIDSVVSDSSHLYGIAVRRTPPLGVQVRDDSISNAAAAGLVWRAPYNPNDDISGNTLVGSHYALDIVADVLPKVPSNNLASNVTDTLLLHGGTVPVTQTLPDLAFRWRVTQPVVVDSGAVFTVVAGDTVTFDPAGSLTIGGATPSALNAVGTPAAPIVFTASSGLFWRGLEFANVSAAGAASVSNVIVEHAGTALPCGGDCLPILFAAVRYSNISTNPVTLDAITVRHSTLTALDVKASAVSPLTVQNSQFYLNAFSPMIQSPSPLLLAIHGSDLYHYNGQIIETADTGTAELEALGNWWGDAAALYPGFAGNDSLGRAALASSRVLFDPIPVPHFAVGPAVQLTPTTDTVLTAAINSTVGDPDSIRARVLDAEGRGVAGTVIGWGTSSGVFQDLGLPTDAGGRAGGVWHTSTAANLQFVQATVAGLIGSPVTWAAFLQPDPTLPTSLNFQVQPLLTAGSVDPVDSNTVTFASSGRKGVFVTHARDQYGNVTQPSGVPDFCFDDVPATGVCHNQGWYQPQYGIIDSVKTDSVFFTLTTATPALLQIHAQYNGGALADSILIAINPVAAGMRITADTGYVSSLCPVGGPYNAGCQFTFFAQLTDSGGAPLPANAAYAFNWTYPLAPDTTITIDGTSGVMNEIVLVSAHKNGIVPLVAQETLVGGLAPSSDTLVMKVQQFASFMRVTPDTISAGLGDVVTFHAAATDPGGQPVAGLGPISWRVDPTFTGYVTILFQGGDSALARIDSAYPSYPRDLDVVQAFAERAPGDTLFGQGVIYNPIVIERGGLGANPTAAAVNPVTNRIYIANRASGSVSVIDGVGDAVLTTTPVGLAPSFIAVNPKTNKVYVSNSSDGTVSVIDGATNSVLRTITVGTSTGAIAVDTAQNFVYVGALVGGVSTLVRIDGNGDAVRAGEEVVLRGDGTPRGLGIAPAIGRAFVTMVSSSGDTLGVVDLNARTLVDSIGGLSSSLFGVAVNAATNRVYVGGFGQVSVIDGTPGVDTLFTGTFIPVTGYAPGLGVNEVRNKIYVSDAGNTLVREIDGATNAVRNILMSSGEVSMDAAANPANGRVYVPHASGFTVLKYFSN